MSDTPPATAATLPSPPFSSQHAHRANDRCNSECPQWPGGYQVFPAEWPQDAEAVQVEIDAVRHELTVLRGRLDDLEKQAGRDSARSLRDARGVVQGAIVMLWGDRERWRETKNARRLIDEHCPIKEAVSGT